MNFFQRLKYFSFGLTLGIIIVFSFFGKRFISCSYFPNSRVLDNIRKKEILFDIYYNHNFFEKNLEKYNNQHFVYYKLLIYGKVNFDKSIIRNIKFPIYQIHYKDSDNKDEVIFNIENKDKVALVKKIKIIKL